MAFLFLEWFKMMGKPRVQPKVGIIIFLIFFNAVTILNALKSSWKKLPPNWKGADPCGRGWEGVTCNNNSRVIYLYVNGFSIYLKLKELLVLSLSWSLPLQEISRHWRDWYWVFRHLFIFWVGEIVGFLYVFFLLCLIDVSNM